MMWILWFAASVCYCACGATVGLLFFRSIPKDRWGDNENKWIGAVLGGIGWPIGLFVLAAMRVNSAIDAKEEREAKEEAERIIREAEEEDLLRKEGIEI